MSEWIRQFNTWASLGVLCFCALLPPFAHAFAPDKNTELLKARRDAAERELRVMRQKESRQEKALRKIESAWSASRRRAHQLEQETGQLIRTIEDNNRRIEALEIQIRQDRDRINAVIRETWVSARQPPLKQWLSADSHTEAERLNAFMAYLGLAHNRMLDTDLGPLKQLAIMQDQQARDKKALHKTRKALEAELSQLAGLTRERQRILSGLSSFLRTDNKGEALKASRQQLETLVAELAGDSKPWTDISEHKGRLKWPIRGQLAYTFGSARTHGLKRNGIEISEEAGVPVRAIFNGQVVFSDWIPGQGNTLVIDHGNNMLSIYGHTSSLLAVADDDIRAGDIVALTGNSGGFNDATGLYFELREKGDPVNPLDWLETM
jgi:septal ring factor EnvC (AmiA/AmiB activator)